MHLSQNVVTAFAIVGFLASLAAIIGVIYQLRSFYQRQGGKGHRRLARFKYPEPPVRISEDASAQVPCGSSSSDSLGGREMPFDIRVQAGLTRSDHSDRYDMLLVVIQNAESHGIEIVRIHGGMKEPKYASLEDKRTLEGPSLPYRIEAVSQKRWAFKLWGAVNNDATDGVVEVQLGSGDKITCPVRTFRSYKSAAFFWGR